MNPTDYSTLIEQVREAQAEAKLLSIQGGGSKHFYGHTCQGEPVEMTQYKGVISYEPSELVLTVRAGTSITEIETLLARENQMLGFEPPCYGPNATIGGVVAAGLSGPRRPHAGAVRDFILGIHCLTGRGDVLSFGGQVMKNVAGYDVARLMTGALGTLGILLEVSVKVLPRPECEMTLMSKLDLASAIAKMNNLAGQPFPLSATAYYDQVLRLRLSGNKKTVAAARNNLEMDEMEDGNFFWNCLREHTHDYFKQQTDRLWRISVPTAVDLSGITGEWFIEWGGAQRWLISHDPVEKIRSAVSRQGGTATLFRSKGDQVEKFHPLPAPMLALHKQIKTAFDPERILNRGRMYQDI